METRAHRARSIATEMGILGAGLGVGQVVWNRFVGLGLERNGELLLNFLLVPVMSFALFFCIAFPLALVFPSLADKSGDVTSVGAKRFAPTAATWWTLYGLLLAVLIWLAIQVGHYFALAA